ncbi:serine O-acetyltransferase [Dyadobacter luticola]|uniref:Serine acetyltransferase n=1 Tax=Dyadobacter luticola TaxID=1979387 RepID=A0A5R9L4G0_9BACT|nr:DapH/DapD/GlmU-related protein [Dyadobacter luticola]TLV03229.1 serine acetyltransferase [Dyadobacter luticola]
MSIYKHITQDWERNRGYTKGKILTFTFRLASLATRNKAAKIILTPYLGLYKFWIEWVFGIEIPYDTVVGRGLKVFHGAGLVINKHTVIGKNVLLRHTTTLGNKGDVKSDCPIIGDNVEIGAQVCILGKIRIGDNAIIGAGSVVTKEVPANAIVVGNPARIVKYRS